ncbi:MAG: ComEC/Rec2 family competence protein [Actinomycetota bacterium]
MTPVSGAILCLAYILGLMSAAVPWGGYLLLVCGILAHFTLPKLLSKTLRKSSKTQPLSSAFMLPKWLYITAGVVGLLASWYLQLRSPQPAANDISKLIPTASRPQEVAIAVRGYVASTPRLTRSGRAQFTLDAELANEINGIDGAAKINREVTGKLYVTVPLLQATGLYPGAGIAVTGELYQPQKALNPGAFDFQAYLARDGIFAGLKGRQIDSAESIIPPSPISWWAARQRIVRSQLNWLAVPEGPLLSAIALGKQAVDLPYNLRDTFVLAGLAHAIAASGTQVSLVLGLVLAVTKRFSKRIQFSAGITALLILLGLTGLEPSICRAAFMGVLTLIALMAERQIQPLAALVLAATILLLINPLWIQDLGFQLSFLATLGLVVTVPPLMKRLDWLPPAIAATIAVPVAASLWTLPRLISVFNCLVPYSILTNILASPLITIMSIGGMISAIAALIWPTAGSAIAWLLHYPTRGLIELAQYFAQLPGNSLNLGRITLLQEVLLYSLIGFVWISGIFREKFKQEELQQKREARKKKTKTKNQKPEVRKNFLLILGRWWITGFLAVGIVIFPVWQTKTSLFQATVLATSEEPVLVIQDREQVALVNSGDENVVRFTVLPFLAQQGINQVNWAIATHTHLGLSSGWSKILERLSIQRFSDNPPPQQTYYTRNQEFFSAIQARQGTYAPLTVNEAAKNGSVKVQLIKAESSVLELQIGGQTWLLLEDMKPESQNRLVATGQLKDIEVLWWTGESLSAELLQAIKPEIAIASANAIEPEAEALLRLAKVQIFWTGRDGALTWTPAGGFKTTLESDEQDISLQ